MGQDHSGSTKNATHYTGPTAQLHEAHLIHPTSSHVFASSSPRSHAAHPPRLDRHHAASRRQPRSETRFVGAPELRSMERRNQWPLPCDLLLAWFMESLFGSHPRSPPPPSKPPTSSSFPLFLREIASLRCELRNETPKLNNTTTNK
ncbi:Uncharacterized protein Rs2_05898 [Raphanus sativus]|nr:Uncharacterized protein Rs2_05898 [Raphanus sativus]